MDRQKGIKRTLPEMFCLESAKQFKADIAKENIPPITEHSENSLTHDRLTSEDHYKIATPKKGLQIREEPVTPNTNFKLLTSLAAELDYANCNTSIFKKPNIDPVLENNSNDVVDSPPNRAEKSLAIICTRFLAMYPLYPISNISITVSLNEASDRLGVGRRRMYDIVNVFESIDMLNKLVKNRYLWFGKNNLLSALHRLKAAAQKENILSKLQYVIDFEKRNSDSKQTCIEDEVQSFNKCLKNSSDLPPELVHCLSPLPKLCNEKSLSIMSQKFLMLFLVSPLNVISLGVAAKVLNGFQKIQKGANIKTQIRRLYDIVSVLSSIGLIQKEVTYDHNGRKTAFKYIGPNLDETPDEIFLGQTKKTDNSEKPLSNLKPRSLVRHSSFQEICAVAEIEHQKLCLDQVPHSAPPFEKNFRGRDKTLQKTTFAHRVDLNNGVKIVKSHNEDNPSLDKDKTQLPIKLSEPQGKSNFKMINLPKQLVTAQGPFYILKPATNEVLKSPTPMGTILLFQPSNIINKSTEDVNSKPTDKNTVVTDTIKLTPEQNETILKTLGISLSAGQATTHLEGMIKISTACQAQPVNMLQIIKRQQKIALSTTINNSILVKSKVKKLHLNDTESNGSSSICSARNKSPNFGVSKFDSLSSGYVTPVSDTSLQSNDETDKNIKGQDINLFKYAALTANFHVKPENGERSNDSKLKKQLETVKKEKYKGVPNFKNKLPLGEIQNSHSGDSLNSEGVEVFKEKNAESLTTKPFLIDDKTILSPIKKDKVESRSSTTSPFVTPSCAVPETSFVFKHKPLKNQNSGMNFSFPVSLKMNGDHNKENSDNYSYI